jgi:aminocarboxymuconate-semialdehyde decarboxylase
MTVIDIHTHMLNRDWLALLRTHGKPRYELRKSLDAPESLFLDGAPFMTPLPGHFDYAYRLTQMDDARVDLAIVSLTSPSVYWGGPEISLQAAKLANDDMAAAQIRYPSRIRWLASLPWEYPELAVAELKRARKNGAVGVFVLANINGRSLTELAFAPIWQAIDDMALPVLVHPTAPPGTANLDLRAFNLINSVGFMMDTTLAFARIIFDGFLDTYTKLKLIAAHCGGTLPFLAGRLDQCFDNMNAARVKISRRPSEYLRRIAYDAVTYQSDALALCIAVGGEDNVMYGSDYPHNIGDMKGCLVRINVLPERQARKLRQANAERIFKL